jgi:two-component system chemotaxis response regulator CheB
MGAQRIVVIGASSGGIEALRQLIGGLPSDFPVPICVVLHTSPQSPGLLGKILADAGALPTATAATGMPIRAGHIYVAPPDRHLLVEPGGLCLGRGPKENRFRPAIDPLFRSAAQVYGPGAVGVILTGNLDDGSAGLRTIKQLGGIAIVQDPRDALFPAMPTNALRHVVADYVVSLAEMAGALREATAGVVEGRFVEAPEEIRVEVAIAKEDRAVDRTVQRIGEPSVFAWSAVRAVEEGRFLLERMAQHGSDAQGAHSRRLREQHALVTDQFELLREMVGRRVALVPTEE